MNKESRFFISIYRINIILLERLEIRILALEDKIRIPARPCNVHSMSRRKQASRLIKVLAILKKWGMICYSVTHIYSFGGTQ